MKWMVSFFILSPFGPNRDAPRRLDEYAALGEEPPEEEEVIVESDDEPQKKRKSSSRMTGAG